MYLTEYILKNAPDDWEIYWVIYKDIDTKDIDKRVKVVAPYTIRYIYALYSSAFVFNNCRSDKYGDLFVKKAGQKYIMTWHGSTPLKKIEKDAGDALSPLYQRNAKRDSQMCDLMLSNCQYFTDIVKRAFWYDGPILMKGLPRNDIYFDKSRICELRKAILRDNNILSETKIVLFAPTFRREKEGNPFKLQWHNIINYFEKMYDSPIVVFLRLHPNSIGVVDVNDLMTDSRMKDMCLYKDMQELLCISDVLITDYSSTMFEMGLQGKVCLLYTPDLCKYDRDFYFDLRDLPFPLAANECELESNIKDFDSVKYKDKLADFNNKHLQSVDTGHACKELLLWMSSATTKIKI